MDQEFEIPLTYRGQELLVPAQLRVQGYSYRIETLVQGTALYFERDDAGDFRAIVPPETPAETRLPDTALVQAVAEALTALLS